MLGNAFLPPTWALWGLSLGQLLGNLDPFFCHSSGRLLAERRLHKLSEAASEPGPGDRLGHVGWRGLRVEEQRIVLAPGRRARIPQLELLQGQGDAHVLALN